MAICPNVTNCRFLRLGCRDEQHELFSASYVRSNKKRSAKLLRCFPHCCPDHKQRSYCGCSLHLLVTFESADAATIAARNGDLVVCARFEAAATLVESGMGDIVAAMLPGAIVALPASALQQPGLNTIESDWVRAEKTSDSYQFSENAILYVLNNTPSPQWCYAYESGSTKAQREMKHVLAAYMFMLDSLPERRLESSREVGAPSSAVRLATVVYRQVSPPFTMVSYRRQSNIRRSKQKLVSEESSDRGDDIEAVANDPMQAPELKSPSALTAEALAPVSAMTPHTQLDSEGEQVSSNLEDTNSMKSETKFSTNVETNDEMGTRPAYSDTSSAESPSPPRTTPWGRTLRCQVCCEILPLLSHPVRSIPNHDTMERLKALFLLQRFVRFTSLEAFSFYFDEMNFHIQSQWLTGLLPSSQAHQHELASASSEPRMVPRISSVFSLERFVVRSSQEDATAAKDLARKQAVLRSCADLLLDTFSSMRVQQILAWELDKRVYEQERETTRHPSLSESCEQFGRLIEDLFGELTQLLVARARRRGPNVDNRLPENNDDGHASISELVDDVLSVIYTEPEYQELRRFASALLLHKDDFLGASVRRLFQSFLTQQQLSRGGRCNSGRGVIGEDQHVGVCSHPGEYKKTEISPARLALTGSKSSTGVWNQRWLLNPASLSLHPNNKKTNDSAGDDSFTALSLLSIIPLTRMFTCVDVQLQGTRFIIASVMVETIPTAPATVLVLDGLTHTLESLPNGLSPATCAALCGTSCCVCEYEGRMSADGSSLELLLFALPSGHSNTTLEKADTSLPWTDSASSEGRIRVSVSLAEHEGRDNFGLSVLAEVSTSKNTLRRRHPSDRCFDSMSVPPLESTMEVRAAYIGCEM